jgi:HlyD family secretion protein
VSCRNRTPIAVFALLGIAALTACRGDSPERPVAALEAPPRLSSAAVAARGRLQPKDGVLRIAGPSDFVVVVARLEVAKGDQVAAGQILALTDTYAVRRSRVASLRARGEAQQATIGRREAELRNARREHERQEGLTAQGIAPQSELDAALTRLQVAEASVVEARAQLEATRAETATAEAEAELAVVRSPRAGQVLQLHARAGEKVGAEGILDLGTTGQMYAIAEVYETDVSRVRPGQRARIRAAALARELEGTVERVGLEVGRLASLGTDPVLKSDARVVEVEIRLDDSEAAAALTNLEVEVLIGG